MLVMVSLLKTQSTQKVIFSLSGDKKNLVQAGEGDPEVVPIFVESQVARYSVEVDPDRCCHVFSERDRLAF